MIDAGRIIASYGDRAEAIKSLERLIAEDPTRAEALALVSFDASRVTEIAAAKAKRKGSGGRSGLTRKDLETLRDGPG